MKSHLELSDGAFEQQFRHLKFDPHFFNHEAHLRLAWIHLNKYGLEIAILNIKNQLKKYVVSLGQPNKYNDTITEAAIRAVYHFTLQSKSERFIDFIEEFPKLKDDFKSLMDSHYSNGIYNSNLAKDSFIKPDLMPFD